jgi:hypothetical protein
VTTQKCREVNHKQLLGALRRSPSPQTTVLIIFDTIFSSKVKIRENIHPPQIVAQAYNTTFRIEPEPTEGMALLF